jgi:sugar phosphate permease
MPVMKMSATTTTTTTSTAWNADEGSSRAARTVAYFASFAALGLTLGAFGPTLPSLAERMGVTIGEIGSLFVARSLGFLLVSARGGRLYDRAPGHRVLAAMLLVMALSMALVPVVARQLVLAVVLCSLRAGAGLHD